MKKVFASTPNPLHSICLYGDDYLEITKSFLDERVDINQLDDDQNTPIIVAGSQLALNFWLQEEPILTTEMGVTGLYCI